MRSILLCLLVLTLINLPSLPASPNRVEAQGDDSVAEINRLARAVHIQNLRNSATTRWIAGDLGVTTQRAVSVPGGTRFTTWRFRDMYEMDKYVDITSMTRPVVMNMWASWCGPCRFEFPFLTDIALNQATNYDLWFVNTSDTSESAARRFLRTQAEGVPVYYDEENRFNSDIRMIFLPTTLLMDTDGTLIAIHAGVVTPTVMAFFNALAANPRAGSFTPAEVSEADLQANILPVDAASATPMVYGQQVAGDIENDSWQDNYRFEGQEGDQLVIDMTTTDEDFDSYLVLIGPDGKRVAENDDGPNAPDAQLTVRLPETGTYILVATRFLEAEGFSRGGYTLTVNRQGETATANDTNYLQPNIPASGRLTRDRSQDVYLFAGSEGQTITVRLEHDTSEEQLNIQMRIGATERIIPYSKTEAGVFETEVTLPQTADYSVYVARSQSSRVGPITYTLIIESDVVVDLESSSDDSTSSGPPASEADDSQNADDENSDETTAPDKTEAGTGVDNTAPPEVAVEEGRISYNQTVQGELGRGVYEIEYRFDGTEGDVITIDMKGLAPDLDTMLYLVGPTGALYAANDDNGRNTDSRIPAYTLPMTGEYIIVATNFSGSGDSGTGAFELTLSQETSGTASAPPEVTVVASSIRSGEAVTGHITDASYEIRYSFQGRKGDTVNIEMNALSGNLDAYLELISADGQQIAFNDDNLLSATDNAVLSGVRLPADGVYTIIATRYGAAYGSSTGEYNLVFRLN